VNRLGEYTLARRQRRDSPEALLIRILLVDDMTLLRTALATFLAKVDCFEVVASVDTNGVAAAVVDGRSDVAVINLNTGGAAAFGAVRTISTQAPRCAVLALTSDAAPAALRQALNSQVRGFLSTNADIAELVTAIKRVAAGERFIERGMALAAMGSRHNPLTPREVDVLRLAGDGLSSAEIAHALFLTDGTVRNYLTSIFRKVGARSRLHAVRAAREANWL
jgi:two-component system response regulator DesR